MEHPNVLDAFEMLLGEISEALRETHEEVATASREGRYAEATALLAEAQQIAVFLEELRGKQKEWLSFGRRRSAGHRRNVVAPRLPCGECTPQDAYCLPILRALVALGGEARGSQVLDLVFAEMKSRLKRIDLLPVQSDPNTPRWLKSANWQRYTMVQEGLLRNDSPRGVWAVTEKGRRYLAEHSA
ncbi:MAG: winged helix-turn-helix domain-containing protein [Candidatus Sumerlaeia bacterium]|nr:winged helix-turn-helix domain-containing protein [Candidatus Sumerlaeia bacterium]